MTGTTAPLRPLWRNRDYLLLWTGGVVSTLGSRMSLLAYPLLTLDLTGSATKAGLIGSVVTGTRVVLRLPAGALVDRWDRRRTMLGCDIVRGCVLATVALGVMTDRLAFGWLLVAAAVEAAASVFFLPAETAVLRHVVGRTQLPQAISQKEARDHGAVLAGPPLGGLLYGIGRGLPFLADFISYAYSTLCLLMIRTPMKRPERSDRQRGLLADIREGLRWTWRQTTLRTILFAAAGQNMVFAALTLAVVLAARESGASSVAIGTMLGAASVGGILGAMVAPWIQRRGRPPVVILSIFWISSAMIPVMAIHPTVWVIGPALAAMTSLSPAANTILFAYQVAVTPDRLQGRVVSVLLLIGTIANPVAPIMVGLIAQAAGSRWALTTVAVVMVIVAIGCSISRNIRSIPQLDQVRDEDAA